MKRQEKLLKVISVIRFKIPRENAVGNRNVKKNF